MKLQDLLNWAQNLTKAECAVYAALATMLTCALIAFLWRCFTKPRPKSKTATAAPETPLRAPAPLRDPGTDGFDRLLEGLYRLRALVNEIIQRTSDQPGGAYPEHLGKSAEVLNLWLFTKHDYVEGHRGAVGILGGGESFVAALIDELHSKLLPLDEALLAESKRKDNLHRAKYVQYLKVISEVVGSLSLSGEEAHHHVQELCELKPVALNSRAGVVRPMIASLATPPITPSTVVIPVVASSRDEEEVELNPPPTDPSSEAVVLDDPTQNDIGSSSDTLILQAPLVGSEGEGENRIEIDGDSEARVIIGMVPTQNDPVSVSELDGDPNLNGHAALQPGETNGDTSSEIAPDEVDAAAQIAGLV